MVPTYQEAANLPFLVAGIHAAMPAAEVLIVDDASGDGTPGWVRAQPSYGTTLRLLERPGKSGFASALCDGYRHAFERGVEVVMQMDADLSHDPADLPRLLEAIRKGADLAVGSRYCPGGGIDNWSRWRQLLSRCAGCYVRAWTGMPLHDPTAGLRAFRTDALKAALVRPLHCDGYAFQVEMAHALWQQGRIIREIPVMFSERREGQSKLSSAIIREAAVRIPMLRFRSSIAPRDQPS